MGPYDGMFKVFGVPIKAQPGGYDALAVLKGWAFLMPEMLDDRAIEATFTPAEHIIKESGFFD